jgi:hypothetical protein
MGVSNNGEWKITWMSFDWDIICANWKVILTSHKWHKECQNKQIEVNASEKTPWVTKSTYKISWLKRGFKDMEISKVDYEYEIND